ncbi:Fic family protein [Actinobacillus delphinicola]|uniref:Filamentation induced by cAMP protein Fic-like protein n=1 Tax=Actinobacillus delphinicola TaxID=51161 RepID=A0A448TTS1_9PAST|nr:Fic family protein [Actinobacillus delphinicola]VEJ09400.1 filamentation induced by cAMP protein Fic-like protein [Actinobacillus delphinicola]
MSFKKIEQLKDFLNIKRPLPTIVLDKLYNTVKQAYIYNSNAIEGNSLSLRETQIVLEQGITIKGKPLKDHIEAKNQDFALDFLVDEVKVKKPLTKQLIKEFHQIIIGDIDRGIAGKFRQHDVWISHSGTVTAHYLHIEEELDALLDWYETSTDHILEKVAKFHAKFEKIHPFSDGNGRTGRLIMNLELMKNGYPITIIKLEDSKTYYQSLETASISNDFNPIIQFIAKNVQQSIERNLKMLDREWKDKFIEWEATFD